MFEMELGAIQVATQDLYESLRILVGEHVKAPDLNYQTGSSHYASATSEPDLDSPRAPQRMSLGPSGAKYLRSRVNRPDQRPAGPSRTPEKPDQQENRQIPAGRITPTTDPTGSSNKLDEYFQMAMNRFLKEQSLVTVQPPPLGTQDIDMESVGTQDLDSWEYDPDDLGIPNSSGHNSGRAAVATAAIGSGNSSSLIQRVRISVISDLKEFTGKDMDEDRAERAKSRQRRSAFGSKFRQKAPASAPIAPVRAAVRAIQTQDPSSESEGVSGSNGSDSEGDLRRIFLAAAEEKLVSTRGASQNHDPARSRTKASEGSRISDRRSPGDRDHQDQERCSHCGSRKHTDLDCWKRLTYENCGKRGHPTDRCLYACRGCGGVHEAGECPMEEFYNQIRKWYDPTRHAELFPEQVEKIYCIYAYVNKTTEGRSRKESDLRGNTCNLHSYTAKIASPPQISEFSRHNAEVALDLKRGESRGY
ncbi:hypothetical protein PHMEG_00033068 [Phytophthora megakarya]|uniref:Eukaryotic/viral aspartic protease n=1 Tax=Phytophthora megakarya TaxID=4795 RepID=A0A225UUL9_9STRA|nr:hypothetical protein PHMEG_00033068 [Phytophthora megakarya]